MPSGLVSIPSAVGSSTVFTVDGTRTLAYAQSFQDYLVNALTSGTLNIAIGASSGGTVTFAAAEAGKLNEAVVASAGDQSAVIGATVYVPVGYQALFDNVNGATTVEGSTSGGQVLVAGFDAAATYIDNGGNSLVIFVDGNNHYIGSTTSTASVDTIVAGTGFDTIDTGVGRATVNSGTGHALINLHDSVSVAAGQFGDYVWLDDGQSTVNADGLRDAVIANNPGQTINGGTSSQAFDGVVLLSTNDSIGDNLVTGGAATMAVYDFSQGNSIYGGAGELQFIGGTDINASIYGGQGHIYVFGNAGDTITYGATTGQQTTNFIAGLGNETLNGSQAASDLIFWGANTSNVTGEDQTQDLITGGAGNDTFFTGEGSETLSGGGGANLFIIDATKDSVGAHITLADFGANSENLAGFAGYSQAEISSALSGAETVMGSGGVTDVVITLSDSTTVTFVGISSLNGHVLS